MPKRTRRRKAGSYDDLPRRCAANLLDIVGDDDLALEGMISVLHDLHGDDAFHKVREALVGVGQGRVSARVTVVPSSDD